MNEVPQGGGNVYPNGAPQGGFVNPNEEFQRNYANMNGMPQPTGGFNVDDPNQMGGMNPQPGQKMGLRDKVKKIYSEMNLPNRLTCLRMILVIPFVIFMLAGRAEGLFMVLSLILFVGASITDLLDGYISRSQNLVTNFGKFMDPLADKILVTSAMICLVDLGRLEAWICIIIIAREFIISGFRLVASDNGIVIAASWWGKTKTVSQMIMVILLIVNFASGPLFVLTVIVKYAALILTIISLCDYINKNKQVLSMQS
jgi:CDP-diacylglycerol--glycerol-3-phosphate 3-phosphatidyltransferase